MSDISEEVDNAVLARQALTRLKDILEDADGFLSCHSFLGNPLGRTGEARWRRLRFSPELAEHFKSNVVRRLLQDLPEPDAIVPFNYEDSLSSQVPFLAKEDFPGLGDWLDNVPPPDWHLTLTSGDPFLEKVKVHVSVLGGEDPTPELRIFRRKTSNALIRKQGMLGSFSAGRNQFDLVRNEIYDLPIDAEFFEWEGFVFVMKIMALESLTDIRAITDNQAKRAVHSLRNIEGLEVKGLQEVETGLASQPRLAKRLASAARNGTFDALKLDTLASHIENYGLPLNVLSQSGKLTISFDTSNRVHVEEFINLVADVYLKSLSTGLNYKAHSKELYSKGN